MSPKSKVYSFKEAKALMASKIAAVRSSACLERIEIKIEPIDMLDWLSFQDNDVKIYGANQDDTMAIAGVGQAVCVMGPRKGRLKSIFKQLRFYLTPRFPYLQWYGGFCFDDCQASGAWKAFGAYRFVLPRFELAAQGNKMIFACNILPQDNFKDILKQLSKIVIPLKRGILRNGFRAPASVRHEDPIKAFGDDMIRGEARRRDFPGYKLWEQHVKKILTDKTTKKVVLARKTSLNFQQPPNPWTMMQQLKKVTANSYHFAFQFKNTVFLGASPERLYQRRGRFIKSEALAGSCLKSVSPVILRRSPKNQYEHGLVVDAIKRACQKFCKTYQAQRSPGILTLSNGHHLITKFEGPLKDGVKDEDILQFLHPTPALGGTPRQRALDSISRLEGFSRGWYGAPIGYVGLDWAEFVVGIRSGLVSGRRLSVFAGAGIVKGSNPKDEWDEIENKISNFIKIIQ